ncbi:MAG: sigma 54-interacting transcriptional regulator [Acidobacteria bacterium]|nr:sigma 54-interacting transcriptional regulator [Acidobacteriota bacterium]
MPHQKPRLRDGLVGAETHQAGNLAAIYGEREEFYRTILDSLAEGVIITDNESRILYANVRMKEISGYSSEELLGRISYQVLSPRKNWDLMRRRLQERLSGSDEDYEHELIAKDGTTRWISVQATPYRNASGEIAGTVGALSCIDRQKGLERENEYLRAELRSAAGLDELAGPSAALARIRNQIAMVAPTEAHVLICGESGTGKELVARAVHDLSERRSKPLVRVNCAAIPKELFESEFFGHARGAFTGAIKDRAGRFELADGGTLFLDEVGEIPLDLQGKLLRVIQEGQFERVGEDRTRTVHVRLISATNRDLVQEASAGRFRLDLYYRLSVFPIEVPPLRERREDIVPLAERFLRIATQKLRIRTPSFTQAQIKELEQYEWPGNVRELQNVIERAAILAAHGAFTLHLDPRQRRVHSARPAAGPFLTGLKDQEKELVVAALKQARGKIYGANGAAALLGLKPTTLASKLARLGLRREDFMHG